MKLQPLDTCPCSQGAALRSSCILLLEGGPLGEGGQLPLLLGGRSEGKLPSLEPGESCSRPLVLHLLQG